MLAKALSYSADLRKPAQIEFYRRTSLISTSSLPGDECEPAEPNREQWDLTRALIDHRQAG